MSLANSFDSIDILTTSEGQHRFFSLSKAEAAGAGTLSRLPFSLKILAENLLRNEDDFAVRREDILALGRWADGDRGRDGREIAYRPSRVVMPDSSGVPLLADLAAMRDAMSDLGGDPSRINPRVRVDLVIDHSAIVDFFAIPNALERNLAVEYERNRERYTFLRWAQTAFSNLRIVPPGNGIIHQINLEFLSDIITVEETQEGTFAHPDTVLGMDSHTPMVNGAGVVAWGCGGIEAGAAMLGQPVSITIPEVVGVRLTGRLREGVTSTDLVLTLTQMLRAHGVVQKFVEFFGPSLDTLPLPVRATIGNMAPEYGATIGFFPIDRETLAYLRGVGRPEYIVDRVEAYARAQSLWRDETTPDPIFTEVVELDLSAVEASVAGPHRPQDRIPLKDVPRSLSDTLGKSRAAHDRGATDRTGFGDGAVVIAAITSCTNTSTPSVMIGAGLLARNAVERGLATKSWVKTSFAPGSRAVAGYMEKSGLQPYLDHLGYQLVGFGCTTCMGNSGPLDPDITQHIEDGNLTVAAVLSGNRNFEGRIHAKCSLNYLASPPLVVAYAIAGSMDIDFENEPLGYDSEGRPVTLAEIWPKEEEIQAIIRSQITSDLYRDCYANIFEGDANWRGLPLVEEGTFQWDVASSYIKRPPFFTEMAASIPNVTDIRHARALLVLGDSITTDHISPVGAIPRESAAGTFLGASGIPENSFNSYAARRVNHDVMLRGTFANLRLRNEMVPGVTGGYTRHMPDGATMPIHEAAERYAAEGVPLVVVAGTGYGSGSSRDWAAKGTRLLGVRAVMAEGFERIHRSNLIGMGVLPLQFAAGTGRVDLGLDGTELYDIADLVGQLLPGGTVRCHVVRAGGEHLEIPLTIRIDTADEMESYLNGGILHRVLRQMLIA